MALHDVMSAAELLKPVIHRSLAQKRDGPTVVGVCGAQGSGKTTLVAALANLFNREGVRTASLSIDDFYLSHEARMMMAQTIHPLLATRGPPGTHDIPKALSILHALSKPGPIRLPRFDKSRDDPFPENQWPTFEGPADLILFEGWCVGARPETDDRLRTPVNALEAECDTDGRWRRFANDALRRTYPALFGRIDLLILLKAPSFEVVRTWRAQQEGDLRRSGSGSGDAVMDDEAVGRFVQHYERLTRHILREMPDRADIVLDLDEDRKATIGKSRRNEVSDI